MNNLARTTVTGVFAASLAFGATCESLAALKLPDTTIASAQSVAAGALASPSGPAAFKELPAFCRVAGSIKPTSDSDIQFEVWLPSSGWNGKFQGAGNGGFAGSIGRGAMAAAVTQGYAAAGTDTGHRGVMTDSSWAPGHPEKLVDYGYRAIHETAEKAKLVIRAFYGEGPRRSYFSACSNGGRQALMEAQRYPADYDGIIAGAPAAYFTRVPASAIWNSQAGLEDPASYISAGKLPAIEAAALDACDALDGVKDGVIGDPERCRFDPSKLLCKGAESNGCLTTPQVAALRRIYAGPRDSAGKQVFHGLPPGAETGAGGWSLWITGTAPGKSLQFTLGTQFFKGYVLGDPAWDYRIFDAGRDTKLAEERVGGILNSTNPDLGRFKARGGKLIMYHGWCDAALPPGGSIEYYQSVVAKVGLKETDEFFRLFMAPGMQHCTGGPGPDRFGQSGALRGNAQHDILSALERWVEQSIAPERIIATKLKTDADPASGVLRQRPLCPYPQVAQWTGKGSTDDAANFVCRPPAADAR